MTSKEVAKWADEFMFTAEKSTATDGPSAILLGGPVDPLGQVFASAAMYKGRVIRDLAEITDDDRRLVLKDILQTVLTMPLEGVHLHFMIEGVTRSFTHQMVRQRTAAYAQESLRFAVKEDMKTAVALPPSLADTLSLKQAVNVYIVDMQARGMEISWNDAESSVWEKANDLQRSRFRWDQAVDYLGDAYLDLVNYGIPAEDARGLLPSNITTRLNYITNLRNWYDTMAVRVSDQAQFEWRKVAMHMALAMRAYGAKQSYWATITREQYESWDHQNPGNPILERRIGNEKTIQVRLSSAWQYEALTEALQPIEFKLGRRAFNASFDRPSRIGERVDAFAKKGIPSSEWTTGSVEHGIPPIHPEEWLLDPNSARLTADLEFDIFGNRVPKGTGWHWEAEGPEDETTGRPTMTGFLTDGYEVAIWPKDFS